LRLKMDYSGKHRGKPNKKNTHKGGGYFIPRERNCQRRGSTENFGEFGMRWEKMTWDTWGRPIYRGTLEGE